MVQAIQFAVRDSAGGRQLGSVAGDAQGNFIQVGAGDSISLNISPSNVVAYEQQGRDLVIKLADGRVIVLAGYFDGTEHHLYLSADGTIAEVQLQAGTDGVLAANYGPAQGWDKWSPLDDLRFAEADGILDSSAVVDEPAGMGIFAPALMPGLFGPGLAAAGAVGVGVAVIGGGGGGGGGDGETSVPGGGSTVPGGGGTTVPGGGGTTVPGGGGTTVPGGGDPGDGTPTRAVPTVNDPNAEEVLTTNTNNPVIIVTGTGEPGDTVTVVVGDKTEVTTINPDGTWGVEFVEPNLPADGDYSSVVTVTQPDGTEIVLDGPDYIIDMTPPAVAVTEGTVSAGDIENLADYADGITIAGTGEAGATVAVAVEGTTHTVTVGADGTWSVTFTQTEVAGGERTVDVTITATDPLGNQTVVTDTLAIDTIPHPVAINAVTADNTVSQAEFDAGFAITGTTTAGATITLEIAGSTSTTTAGADGSWTISFPPGSIAGGTYTATVTASTVDAAGNASSTSTTFAVDTEVTVSFAPDPIAGDNIVNMMEATGGVTMTGSSQPGSSVSVEWGGTTVAATTAADGSWSVTFPGAQVPEDGTTVATVTATDSVGNTTSATRTITVDTSTSVTINAPVTGDDMISGAERDAGFALSGTAEPGATVVVEFGGMTKTVTATAAGTWTATYAPGSIPSGFYEGAVTVTATDVAGNMASTGRMIAVDTETNVTIGANQAGDNVISGAERTAGVTLTGTAEPGASVEVTLGTTTHTVTASATGTWSAAFATSEIPSGTTSATVSVRATDVLGNTATATHTLQIDTENAVTINANQTGDNQISGAERSAGFSLTGTAEAGASVVVSFEGTTQTVTAGANGTWTATYAPGEIRTGTYDSAVSVTSTDAAGNVASATHTVHVDTETNVGINATQAGDNVISGAERSAGVMLTGTAEAGASVAVTMGTTTHTVIASPAGTWSATFATSEIPAGTSNATVSVTATDALGNTASATHAVKIDTEVVPLTRGSLSAGADEVVNHAEAARGLTITGTVEAGSTVMVQFGTGAPLAATVAANGAWSVTVPAGHIPQGETTATLNVVATDAYGNTRTHTETVQVDRVVRNFEPAEAQLSGDGYLNAEEAQQGLVVNGTAEPGATVVVQIAGGGSMTVTAGTNGLWTTTFAGANLPSGELETTVSVTATDRAGNVSSYSQPLIIDTIAPGAPDVETFTRNSVGLTRIQTDEVNESYEFIRIDANGNVSEIDAVRNVDDIFGTQNVSFGSYNNGGGFTSTPVPDGSYLVVNTTDLAGNESSTLLVVNNTNAPEIDLSRAGLTDFDFSAIDLTFAPDALLSITEAQILNITGADKTLVIKGAEDDRVSIVGGTATGATQEIDGEIYNIYTVGNSGATILLDDDITVI